ncbi:hypothetical protein [Wolbachia endosymbiont (group A) of Barypeithes pellucidus]|uniref:hypothetical protein n=1 Tax=Wolbachia endosymbiont (group A) of Barypeithes pellucidus TaxID=3139322 RepID=UPI003CCA86A2
MIGIVTNLGAELNNNSKGSIVTSFDALEEQEPISNIGKGDGSNGLGKVESVVTSEEQKLVSSLEGREKAAGFNIPLSIFHYKDYDSDFFTSWYNISSRIFKEVNRACPEKKVLNLALSVLMFPYIVFTALGLAVYNKLKTNDKTQISSEEKKTKKSEVSESTAKRLAYGVLAPIAVLVSIPILLLLLIPATPALATFYLLNRKLSHSLVAVLKVSSGSYQKKHQNIEVSFREIDAGKSDIMWDMEAKFPPQFKQLLRDLYEDPEHNAVLKLSANINLKNGLRPLRNEIKNVLATSIQEFAKTMEELMKLEKKDITYDKLKELLNEFRLKVVDSVDSKLISHLIQDAHRVAFIQAIKIAQKRKEDFSLEGALRDILVKQELESQGKELPSEKEIIIKDLKELKGKEALDLADEDDRLEPLAKIGDITSGTSDDALPMFKAKWKQLIKEGKIAERTIIGIYKGVYPKETAEALRKAEETIKGLKGMGEKKICEELKEIYENRKNSGLKDDALKRKLEDLFKFEYDDQEIEKRLIESRIRTIQTLLNKSDNKVKQSLAEDLSELNETKTSDKVNDFVEKMYLEITRCRIQGLFEKQEKGIKNIEDNTGIFILFNKEDEKRLIKMIISDRKEIGKYLTQPARLKEIIEKQNKDLDVEKNSNEKESSSIELIELCLKNNQEILEALEQLESEKKGFLINEETKNDYKEELTSRERIKFAIIEDDLLKVFKLETFDREAIKKLLEKAELEYCLAEKCIKGPVIKTKDNIKHFSQNLLSPLINRLVNLVISNVPKDNQNIAQKAWNSLQVGLGYIRLGLSATVINKNGNVEGKALSVAHDTHKEIETFLEHFESSYEKAGAFLGDLFSDDGETFKDDVWPKIEKHLHGMWNRFFKDVEFKIGSRLDEVSLDSKSRKL